MRIFVIAFLLLFIAFYFYVWEGFFDIFLWKVNLKESFVLNKFLFSMKKFVFGKALWSLIFN